MLKWITGVAILITALAACSPNNVTVDNDIKKYFDQYKVTGTFSLFDNGQGSFTVYNLPRFGDSAYSPASTFKIVNSLIGIEEGVVNDTNGILKWDSVPFPREECTRDMKMTEAFRLSCVPFYRNLARRVGEKRMQFWLDTLGYARRNDTFRIKNNLDTFWLDNTAKVTADEQLGLVKKLYFDQLPFQKRTQRLVRGMMLWENDANYKLSYKTGWNTTEKGNQLGWIIGWIEENKHPYFFVLQVESPDPNVDFKTIRIGLLKAILKDYGFFQGKR